MFARKNFFIGIILILLVLLFVIWYVQPKTLLIALEKEYMGKEESVFRFSGLIEQIDINSDESLLFYYNGNGNVNCAVAEKRFCHFKIVDVSAELSTSHETLRAGLFGSTYDKGNKWVYFGIIYDDSVKKIVWSNAEATRFSTHNLEMFYAVGSGNLGGGEYYLYDAEGNELDYHRLVK